MSEPTTAACSRCGHPSHELGKCQARYHVTYNAAEVGETCLCAIEAEARQQDGSAAEWKRKYEGMVKERDNQVYRKREARRILEARSAPPALDEEDPDFADDVERGRKAGRASLDVERLAAAARQVFGGKPPGWEVPPTAPYQQRADSAFRHLANDIAAEYARLAEPDA